MLTIKTEQFEGPLDLLLRLIEQEQMNISEVSLAKVTDQYLQRLSELSSEFQSEEIADFLVVASKLILIKSRSLLPRITHEEEEEIEDLQRQLKIYQEFLHASKTLEKMLASKRITFAREQKIVIEKKFSPPTVMDTTVLYNIFQEIIMRAEVTFQLPKRIVFDTRISIAEKMTHLKELLSKRVTLYFQHCITNATSRAEIVVSFLALLELIKQRFAVAHQEQLFEEIRIEPFVQVKK